MGKAEIYTVYWVVGSSILGALAGIAIVLFGGEHIILSIISSIVIGIGTIYFLFLLIESMIKDIVNQPNSTQLRKESGTESGQGTEIRTEYDDERNEVLVQVGNQERARAIKILIDGQEKHTFRNPTEGDYVILDKKQDEDVEAKILKK